MKIVKVLPLLLTLSQENWKHHHFDDRSEYIVHYKYFAFMHTVWMQVSIKAPAWDDIQRKIECGGLSAMTKPALFRWGAHHSWHSHLMGSFAFSATLCGHLICPQNCIAKVIWTVDNWISPACLMVWTTATSVLQQEMEGCGAGLRNNLDVIQLQCLTASHLWSQSFKIF